MGISTHGAGRAEEGRNVEALKAIEPGERGGTSDGGIVVVCIDRRSPPRYVVIDKPAGLLSVPGKGADKQDCASGRVRAAFPAATGPVVVHRLDMDTSGLLLFALDEDAQRRLSGQFEGRTVAKAYTALVSGVPAAESGVIDAAMRADIERRPYQVIDPVHGRRAVTRWTVVALETDRTRLQLVPETGRTHQLRVHCAHMGHPILGDVLYGKEVEGRLMLHASELEFDDPTDGSRVVVNSAAPF